MTHTGPLGQGLWKMSITQPFQINCTIRSLTDTPVCAILWIWKYTKWKGKWVNCILHRQMSESTDRSVRFCSKNAGKRKLTISKYSLSLNLLCAAAVLSCWCFLCFFLSSHVATDDAPKCKVAKFVTEWKTGLDVCAVILHKSALLTQRQISNKHRNFNTSSSRQACYISALWSCEGIF